MQYDPLALSCELTTSPGNPRNRFRQVGNEFLAELVQRADDAHVSEFNSDQVALWWADRRSRAYVQRMLSRLKNGRYLSAWKTPRWLIRRSKNGRTYRRGVMNVYRLTVRGRQRAAWWVKTHSLVSLTYLASTPPRGKELAQAMALKPFEELRSLFSGGPRLLTFRSRDRDSLGPLLYALSGGRNAYLIENPVLWIDQLKQDRVVPDHLGSLIWHSCSLTYCGATSSQIIISILYNSARYHMQRAQTIEGELKQRVQELESELRLQGISFQQERAFNLLEKRLALLENDYYSDRYYDRMLDRYREIFMSAIRDLCGANGRLSDANRDLTGRIRALEREVEWEREKWESDKSTMEINSRLASLEKRLDYVILLKRERRACERILTDYTIRRQIRARHTRKPIITTPYKRT